MKATRKFNKRVYNLFDTFATKEAAKKFGQNIKKGNKNILYRVVKTALYTYEKPSINQTVTEKLTNCPGYIHFGAVSWRVHLKEVTKNYFVIDSNLSRDVAALARNANETRGNKVSVEVHGMKVVNEKVVHDYYCDGDNVVFALDLNK